MSFIDGISSAIGRGIETVKSAAEKAFEKIKGKNNKQMSSEVTAKTDENESVDSSQLQDDTKKTGGWAELAERKKALNEEMALIDEAKILQVKIANYKSNPKSMTEEEYNNAVLRLQEIQLELQVRKTNREIEEVNKAIDKDIQSSTPKFG